MTNPTLYLKKLVKGQNKQLQWETQREVYQESDSQTGELREEGKQGKKSWLGNFQEGMRTIKP